MRKWNIILAIFGVLTAGLIFLISREAIIETENWKLFDLDYTEKGGIISSYGTLLAALLSTLSIIFLIYTILFQSRESIAQANRFETDSREQQDRFEANFTAQQKRFKKAHKLQKKQFEAQQKREERKEKLDLYYKLRLISVFLESIINHIEKTGEELKRFYQAEESKPLTMNMLYFLVNKNMSKLIEMDYLSIFIAFKEFFSQEVNWTEEFNKLFSLVGFYKDALDELRENFKYHKNDKYVRKSKIAEELKSIMDEGAKIIDKYKNKFREGYLEHPFSNLINEFIPRYYEILQSDEDEKKETDLDELSQGLLLEFLQEAMGIRDRFGFDDLGSEELTGSISSIRKDIYKLKFDCTYFANDSKHRYNDYFSPESPQLKKLLELKLYIEKRLKEIDPDQL